MYLNLKLFSEFMSSKIEEIMPTQDWLL